MPNRSITGVVRACRSSERLTSFSSVLVPSSVLLDFGTALFQACHLKKTRSEHGKLLLARTRSSGDTASLHRTMKMPSCAEYPCGCAASVLRCPWGQHCCCQYPLSAMKCCCSTLLASTCNGSTVHSFTDCGMRYFSFPTSPSSFYCHLRICLRNQRDSRVLKRCCLPHQMANASLQPVPQGPSLTQPSQGLISRFYETFLVFTLVAALLFGMTFLLSAILDYGQTSMQSLFALWCGYLPFLYSCLSCFGVVLLLICTPVGFARLFTVLGELVIKPKFLRDIQDEHQCAMMEEENLRRRAHIISHELEIHHSTPVQRIRRNGCAASALKQRLLQVGKVRRELASSSGSQAPQPSACASSACCHTTNWETAATSGTSYMALQQLASPWRRNLGYPLAMLVLLSLTIISLLMVIHNMLQLLIGIKALPISPQVEKFSLGISSLSALGVVGSSLEIVLILYPYQRCLLPRSTYELHVSCGLIVVCEYGAESCSGLAIQANALRIIPELYQLPVAGICGGFLLTACLLSATTEAIISHCDANHRQLCHPACAQFCTACTCQDTGQRKWEPRCCFIARAMW
ncbi:LMBR1-like protein lilipod isoform X7 [Rhipicephalus microplus]|uniref:LMBR1-like protein lilipod isoform X7 n=1 Tax=Rhipicephalus microplus TaxID=6941 RepID=UPI003F6C6F9D